MKDKSKWLQIALIVLDVLLIVALFGVFHLENGREARTSRILKKALSKVEAGLTGTDSAALAADSTEELAGTEQIPVPTELSIRGDSFAVPGGDPQTAYPAVLQRMLKEAGSTLTVQDYTLDEKSVLTHLYYAGVPSSDIQSFIHRNIEAVGSEDPFETGVGDVKNLVLERTDQNAIPVIFVGYNGGWGKSVFELIEMEKKILATYNQQQYYIIIGNHPLGVEDVDTYDKIMQGYWGSHYLGVTKIAGSTLNTYEGHVTLAERIMAKLEQQGLYVPPAQDYLAVG